MINSQGSFPSCNRFGWFMSLFRADVQYGPSGPLYIRRGSNDIPNALQVGTWWITPDPVSSSNSLQIHWIVYGNYRLARVYYYISSDFRGCDPQQPSWYLTDASLGLSIFNTPLRAWTGGNGGGSNTFIVYAEIVELTTATVCPPPIPTR
ncbi:hypothetical protein QBC34DRAFT_461630 [Podospora aff. communis PSN243]|uniref:Uncharacterized protein n=1 Tax=Podospora aff. communis PSN243 TaxID=3040156 RepID=A0AAV9GPL4_9PEZI|nr:hypothetical protein QBC34DRAFT_461630 [Podospora aff. communis PSN243]